MVLVTLRLAVKYRYCSEWDRTVCERANAGCRSGILLDRVFRGLRQKGNIDYFNSMYGRTDLNSPNLLLDKLGYTDALLLAMLLEPGQATEYCKGISTEDIAHLANR